MATWIRADESQSEVTPANGKVFTLAEMQRFVGGHIEALPMRNGKIMWINEEGKLKQLPPNLLADHIAHRQTGIALWDQIVGDVLIATVAETEGEEEEE